MLKARLFLSGVESSLTVVNRELYAPKMKSVEELKKKYPELQRFSDEELRSMAADIDRLVRIMFDWCVEEKLGSNGIPVGLLLQNEQTEYDGGEE